MAKQLWQTFENGAQTMKKMGDEAAAVDSR